MACLPVLVLHARAASRDSAMKRVAIIQRLLPHYRIPLFDALHQTLAQRGIGLTVYFGREKPGTVPRTADVSAPWAKEITNHYWSLGAGEIVWQSVIGEVTGADLVIVEQAMRLPLNLWLQARRLFCRSKVAFWGHGRNLQARGGNRIVEGAKKVLLCGVDWWFAYTPLSASIVIEAGFPSDRLTILNNTVDTQSLERDLREATAERVDELRREWGIRGENVGLYIGGMYPDKRLSFLISGLERIRSDINDFEMIFLGDGPDSDIVEAAAQRFPWVHFPGLAFGQRKATSLALARVLLMPGAVGLVAVESLIAGVPLATTAISIHGPEIAYLVHDQNALVADDDIESYAREVVGLLRDSARLARLRTGCIATARTLSLAGMVDRFADGISACI